MTLEETIAVAICNAFWRTAEDRRTWATSSEMHREVFRLCAKDAIEAARQFKERQAQARAA